MTGLGRCGESGDAGITWMLAPSFLQTQRHTHVSPRAARDNDGLHFQLVCQPLAAPITLSNVCLVMENGLVNLAAIVGGLVFAMSIIPVLFLYMSRGEKAEPPLEEQFAIRDEDDV